MGANARRAIPSQHAKSPKPRCGWFGAVPQDRYRQIWPNGRQMHVEGRGPILWPVERRTGGAPLRLYPLLVKAAVPKA